MWLLTYNTHCPVLRVCLVLPSTAHTHAHTRSHMDPLMTWLLRLNIFGNVCRCYSVLHPLPFGAQTHTHTSVHSRSRMHTYVYSPEPHYDMASPVFTCMGSCCWSRYLSPSPPVHTHAHTHVRTQRILLLLHAWTLLPALVCPSCPAPKDETYKDTHICARTHTDTHTLLHPGAHTAWLFLSRRVLATWCVQPSSPTSSAHSLLEPL